jgi:hypothetical protein
VGELVGGGGDLRSDDVEHRERIPKPEVRIQKLLLAAAPDVI